VNILDLLCWVECLSYNLTILVLVLVASIPILLNLNLISVFMVLELLLKLELLAPILAPWLIMAPDS
jgi:hypothetical protein